MTQDADVAAAICEALAARKDALTRQFRQGGPIRHFVVDGLLPPDLALEAYRAFPNSASLHELHSLRERKRVGAQMDAYDPLLGRILFAFQDKEVCALLQEIMGRTELIPDPDLYAGGLSLMEEGHFLNPHLDNSHDRERRYWRIANALYYVTPDWAEEDGGSLELWPEGPRRPAIVIPPRFNRLVLMETHDRSWHSVDAVRTGKRRCCISNYYFSARPNRPAQRYRVTSYRGRPEQPLRDIVLQADNYARQAVRRLVGNRMFKTFHEYRRKG
ncbi:MAG: 2OG-Fe(II) oxygenase [Alphaproteobacteria bacterium]